MKKIRIDCNTVIKGTVVDIWPDGKGFEIETNKGFVMVSISSTTEFEKQPENAKGVKIFGNMFMPEQIDALLITTTLNCNN